MSHNYRSIQDILNVANAISGRKDETTREFSNDKYGAYYAVYGSKKDKALIDYFYKMLEIAGLSAENSAVLYMASKAHVLAMLEGVGTELGRIGYVAVTRAKNLFILGVPKSALSDLLPRLLAIGLKKFKDEG